MKGSEKKALSLRVPFYAFKGFCFSMFPYPKIRSGRKRTIRGKRTRSPTRARSVR